MKTIMVLCYGCRQKHRSAALNQRSRCPFCGSAQLSRAAHQDALPEDPPAMPARERRVLTERETSEARRLLVGAFGEKE
jgi:hypothetical protein